MKWALKKVKKTWILEQRFIRHADVEYAEHRGIIFFTACAKTASSHLKLSYLDLFSLAQKNYIRKITKKQNISIIPVYDVIK